MKYIAILEDEHIVRIGDKPCLHCFNGSMNDYFIPVKERKVGKWIYDKTIQNWRCSECNETPKTLGFVGTADFMVEHFRFCNHCGAEMERVNDRR